MILKCSVFKETFFSVHFTLPGFRSLRLDSGVGSASHLMSPHFFCSGATDGSLNLDSLSAAASRAAGALNVFGELSVVS